MSRKNRNSLRLALSFDENIQMYNDKVEYNYISEIIPNKIYLSCFESIFDIENLKNMGITSILHISDNEDEIKKINDMMKLKNFNHKFVFLQDKHKKYDDNTLDNEYENILDFIKSEECVLVQCREGRSRSVTIVILYLMKYENKSYDEAIRMIQSKRECISIEPYYSFKLLHFERMFRKNRQENY